MPKGKITILVIDDEKDFSFFLKKNLERQGTYKVFTAISGKEGIKKTKTIKPDLIFLDILMPGISGFEVLDKLKEDKSTQAIPVIMLSGNSDDDSKVKVAALTEGYIEKPVGIEILRVCIEKTLAKNKKQDKSGEKDTHIR